MRISIISAIDKNRLIGSKNDLPWHLPADMKHFKEVTTGHPIIMGENTYRSVGRALPGRTNIILSRNPDFSPDGCHVAYSFDDALAIARESEGREEVFICGGANVYAQALTFADRMYLTLIDYEFEGDVHFPKYSSDTWKEISREQHNPDKKNIYSHSFVVLEKQQKTT